MSDSNESNKPMKSESELEAIRERVVSELKETEGGSIKWHKLEAMEVALDCALEDNDILENLLESWDA